MPRSIVVPLDGSRFAEHALPVAASLARAAGARLRLLIVHEPLTARVPAVDLPIAGGLDELGRRAQAEAYLAALARELGVVGAGPAEYEVVDGPAAATIVTVVTKRAPDLIVMSTHGRGALSRFWLGSVADHLVRHVSTPILLLRPQEGDSVPSSSFDVRDILVPLDLSPVSEAILDPVKTFAHVARARITLLTVVEPILGAGNAFPFPVALEPELLEARRSEAQQYLSGVADRLRAGGLEVATKVVVALGAAMTILGHAEKDHHDLVAMSTHGASGVRRFLLGSVADKVIRGGTTPVLVYRPPDAVG
ncbi:MAG: universal stress protein [Gemmatimonadota bacterium]